LQYVPGRRLTIKNIHIIDAASDIAQITDKLKSELAYSAPYNQIDSFLEILEGWWFQIAIEHLIGNKECINSKELQSKVSSIRDSFSQDNLPNHFGKQLEISDQEVKDFKDKTYIKQLEIISIKLSSNTAKRAISDFRRAFQQRSKWLRLELLSPDEQIEYDEKLYDYWKNLFDIIQDECAEKEIEQIREIGNKFYLNQFAKTCPPVKIREKFNEDYLTRGSYQILSDSKRIGWHVIGDSYPVGVLTQVSYHMLRTGHGCFTEDHPGGIVRLADLGIESFGFTHGFKFAFEAFQEFPLKGSAELMHRVQVFFLSNAFPVAPKGVSCRRDNAMNVRVQTEVLPPGVQHGNGPGFCPVVAVPKAVQSAPNGRKKQVVIHGRIPQTDLVQVMRHGKDDVKMLYRQGKPGYFLYPQGLFAFLAFGTMPVSAAVIAIAFLATMRAYLLMASQYSGAAPQDVMQGFDLPATQALFSHELPAKAMHHRGQLMLAF